MRRNQSHCPLSVNRFKRLIKTNGEGQKSVRFDAKETIFLHQQHKHLHPPSFFSPSHFTCSISFCLHLSFSLHSPTFSVSLFIIVQCCFLSLRLIIFLHQCFLSGSSHAIRSRSSSRQQPGRLLSLG